MINPFRYGAPVTAGYFFGRDAEFALLDRRVRDAAHNRLADNYVFLAGRRGYGKTSILRQFERVHAPRHDALFVFVTLAEKTDLTDFFEEVIDQLFMALEKHLEANRGVWDSLVGFFRGLVPEMEGLTIAGFRIKWAVPRERRAHSKASFLALLPRIWKEIKQKTTFRSLVIAVDELDRFEDDYYKALRSNFAYAWKEIADAWRTECQDLFVVMSCLLNVHDYLLQHQPSLSRHFDTLTVGRFSRTEIAHMIEHSLRAGTPRKTASEAYIDHVSRLSGGIPGYVQLISRIAFEKDADDVLDRDDFLAAVPELLERVCGQFHTAVRQVKHLQHAVRVLRCLAAVEEHQIRRADLLEKVRQSFTNYDHDDEFELAEDAYGGDAQAGNTLSILAFHGLVEKSGRGIYRITDPVCDCWVNHALNGFSIEEAVRRSK